jgi:serine/threonine-protein kinase
VTSDRYLDAESVKRLLGGDNPIPKAGDVIAGKYRILGRLGEGGVGTILAAHHELLDKEVALKLLALEPTAKMSRRALTERFLIEARAAAKVESPHVARVMDVGKLDNGAPFMVMERLEGCNLEELLALEGTLSVEDTADYVMQALQGLAHAHVLGVVHRDLKPANLFLARQPDGSAVIKIVDFGIAMLLDEAGRRQPSTRVTRNGTLVGSPMYMSPEQVRDEEHIDHRTDIWSVGVVLHELLTGQVPFGVGAEGMGEIFGAILNEPLAPVSGKRNDVSPALDAVIARCLSRSVDERYSDVSEIARALAPFGTGKWNHLVDSIEQSFRTRMVKMTGSEAFKPIPVEIVHEPEPVAAPATPPEPAPIPAAKPEPKSALAPTPEAEDPPARGGILPWLIVAIVVAAGIAGWVVLGH